MVTVAHAGATPETSTTAAGRLSTPIGDSSSGIGGDDASSCHPGDPDMVPISTDSDASTVRKDQTAVKVVNLPNEVTQGRGPNGEHVKTVLFRELLIDRIYPSMHGPWKEQGFRMLPPSDSPFVWITAYRAEVLDGETGLASQEFMCHTNLRAVGARGAPAKFQYERAQLSISQGQKEIEFPKGFALRVENTPERQMNVSVMVLNNNDAQIHRSLSFRSTVRYYDHEVAVARHLVPLVQTAAYTACLTNSDDARPGEIVCKPASPPELSRWIDGRERTGHWMVPPGRHVITNDVTRILNLAHDTTLHYIWMHVHPYAESLELRDDTTGKTVWKGSVVNPKDPKVAQVLSTDAYSGTDGIALFKDHQYSLTTIYDNRTSHDVDAMAALWMYVRDQSES